MHSIPLLNVRVTDAFWSSRQKLMTDVTIPYMEKILRDEIPDAEKSHALSNFRMAAGEETGTFYGMVFQDSDIAKWLEAAAYSLSLKPDKALEKRLDDVIALIGRAQQPDGYLNTFFTVKEPENRWQNLLECHELYCAGHMMEAGAALYEATGKRNLLDICLRLADHIIGLFGEGQRDAIPGHQEIELGLLRLYHVTGETKYRDMAQRFLDLRGQDPEWFQKNTPMEPGKQYGGYGLDPQNTQYNQSDVPVREQTKARGHAVRQVYMLAAMADAAALSSEEALIAACDRMFDNITQRQMYVTGAVGSTEHYEAFTDDFDLPNDTNYGETCASVAMAFFAQKMLCIAPRGKYADLLETQLYNGALAGMQMDGERYFYVNPLEVDPRVSGIQHIYKHVLPQRPRWHACACCPPNLARIITSLGKYLWGEDESAVYSHMMIGNEAQTRLADIRLETNYPWSGEARYTLSPKCEKAFALAIHIPGYVKDFAITVNGESCKADVRDGYAYLNRVWQSGDTVCLSFPLEPRRIWADPRVRADAGKVALAYGPLIYCLEGVDNGEALSALRLPRDAKLETSLQDGLTVIKAEGTRDLPMDTLYSAEPPKCEKATLSAIPYYAWSNRGLTSMCVWIRE